MTASRTDLRESGASAVEYALLVAAIAAIIVLVVWSLGTWVKGTYTDTCTQFASVPHSTTGSSCS